MVYDEMKTLEKLRFYLLVGCSNVNKEEATIIIEICDNMLSIELLTSKDFRLHWQKPKTRVESN